MSEAAVEIRDLVKEFRTAHGVVRALDHVSLDVGRGEFLCVVGPSGCGKTTLLNIVGGLEAPTAGRVEMGVEHAGRPVLSIVFQEQGVFPWLTVLDNAAFGLMARGVPRSTRHAIARDLLARMGLERFERAYPRELSGGMRQRVNLARAFANDPQILLMDEPFASLDEQTKLLLQDDLLRVWEGTRKTVLFITHSLDEAIRLADRVLVMTARPGRIKAVIPVELPPARPGLGATARRGARRARVRRGGSGGLMSSQADVGRNVLGRSGVRAAGGGRRWSARPSREQVFVVVSPLLLLIAWEILARAGVLDVRIFSMPTAVAGLMWQMLRSGELVRDSGVTLARLLVGMLVGVLPGLVLGLTMGLFRWPRAILNPVVSAIYPLPRVALFPLVLLIVGLNETSNIIMIALGPFFAMLIGTLAGVMNVDPVYLKVARSFKVSTFQLYTQVVFPAALPIIFSAFRLSLGLGLLGVVSVEFLMANTGLGYLIWHSWQLLSLPQSMVGLVATGLIGYALFLVVDWLERRALPWARS
jgi:NitT/TauT family transport system ATP-binding protein